jgi:NAD(P)H dehydrogenase (quinone)
MAKGIVVYYSRSGNTKKMAQVIAEGMNEAQLPTECKSVEKVKADELRGYDAIVVGSPTYYGQMDGKVGAAFSSAANIGGGNETTIMGIIEAMLISGMVVQGDPAGDHYGPVSIGKPDDRVIEQCRRRGNRIAELTNRLRD